jgi:hypothetical protein
VTTNHEDDAQAPEPGSPKVTVETHETHETHDEDVDAETVSGGTPSRVSTKVRPMTGTPITETTTTTTVVTEDTTITTVVTTTTTIAGPARPRGRIGT